jgi:basic membrane protein A
MSKKIIALVLVIVMLASTVLLSSCKKEDGEDKTNENVPTIKVGAIYITSQNDTAGYTYAHHNGIKAAVEALKIPSSNFFIEDNVEEDATQVTAAIDRLAGKGCDIIFGISFGYLNAFDDAAKKEEYKDIIFSHGTGYLSSESTSNLKEGEQYYAQFNNYFGRIYQARYLSGIAAGLKSLALNNNNLGYVAAWGTEYAETCSGINAFALGAQSVNPNAVVHVQTISTWGDEQKEKQAAETLIDTHHCCVIAQHCDSAQPQLVAADKGVFGCGYNSDMSAQAPAAHLTAPIWNWDVYYTLAIRTAIETPAKYMEKVGNYYGGLKEGFVNISPLSTNCTADTAAKIEAVKALMISGEWDVFSNQKLSFDTEGNIVKTQAALIDNKDETVISADGNTLYVYDKGTLTAVEGGAGATDGVIKGSMNYYVKGVIEH